MALLLSNNVDTFARNPARSEGSDPRSVEEEEEGEDERNFSF